MVPTAVESVVWFLIPHEVEEQRTHMSSITTAHAWKSSLAGRIAEASSFVKQLSFRRTIVGKKLHSVWSLFAFACGLGENGSSCSYR